MDTGQMRQKWAITANNTRGRVKSKMNYSSIHEEGTDKIPRRKIFPSKKQGNTITRKVFQQHIDKIWRGF